MPPYHATRPTLTMPPTSPQCRCRTAAFRSPALHASDEELWLCFAETDCQAGLDALHNRYLEPLKAWIRRCGVRDDARVADLFQDVWVRLVSNRHRFDPSMRWGTWAFHIAKNLARNEGRRLQRRFVTPESDFRIESDKATQVQNVVSSSLPEEMMLERQLSARLESILAGLTDEQRSIFALRFVEGRSNEQVSQILGIPLTALKARAKRVRLKVLRDMRPLLDDTV